MRTVGRTHLFYLASQVLGMPEADQLDHNFALFILLVNQNEVGDHHRIFQQQALAFTRQSPMTPFATHLLLEFAGKVGFQAAIKQAALLDSRLEADFASEFEQKMGGKRGHWRLTRESEVLLLGDTVMIPDFILVDDQDENRKIMIELVGFWHPQYLRRKVEKVRAANCATLLLLVYQGLKITDDAFQDVASEVIFFKQKPVLKEVMDTVEAMAERVYGPRSQPKRKKRSGVKS